MSYADDIKEAAIKSAAMDKLVVLATIPNYIIGYLLAEIDRQHEEIKSLKERINGNT